MSSNLLYRIAPHNMGSNSAKLLQEALSELTGTNVLRVFPDRAYVQRPHHRIVNWGRMAPGNWHNEQLLDNIMQSYDAVRLAGCKRTSLQLFEAEGLHSPETGDVEWAYGIVANGGRVYARNELRGHGGEGIEVLNNPAQVVNHNAPLFVKAIDIAREYRIHVFNGEVIHMQEKRRRREVNQAGEIDYEIRNHEGGWVYCIQDVNPSETTIDNSKRAVELCGAVFGAVDVAEDTEGNTYVLEVNTAPGLCNQTAGIYAEKIVNYFEGDDND